MKKHYTIPIVIILIILPVIIILTNNSENSKEVCIEGKKCFSIEIVDNSDLRRIGLSNHESLEKNEGMFFIFEEEGIHGFWMKDMDFSIDIIQINSDLKIVGIEENLPPCLGDICPVFYPLEKIKYVLEISSGLSNFYNFEKGNSVELKQ